VTPEQRHSGLATTVLQQRQAVYAQERTSSTALEAVTRAWQVAREVWLNRHQNMTNAMPRDGGTKEKIDTF
jgi:hypothetical protein